MSARLLILASFVSTLFVSTMLGACQPEEGGAARDAGPGVVTSVATSADGLEIAYDVRGEGEIALVFVHCWACDRDFWREQADAFSADYRVVTLDLGGHGRSSTARETWTIRGLAGDVKVVADALSLERIVLIGHSMGGPVSLEAARLLPGRVLGVIAVDTLHDAELEIPEEQVGQMSAAFEADFQGTLAGMFSGMAAGSMEAELREWIVARASRTDPEVAVALMRDFANLDLPRLFAEARVPIRAVNAAPSGMTPATNIDGNRQYADFDATIVDGVGHFLHLEKPAAFNRLLREYAAEIGARAGVRR